MFDVGFDEVFLSISVWFVHQVNNEILVDADHHRAVAVLKEAGNDVTMVVARVTATPAVTFQPPVRVPKVD